MIVAEVREQLVDMYRREQFVPDKSGGKLVEIVGASFLADEPAIIGTPDEDYIERELVWYLTTSRYVQDIPGGAPKIWQQVADRHGRINSNYGWCVFSKENGFQHHNVVAALKEDPSTRQAVMVYTRPSMHDDATTFGMSDFMCTNAVQYVIRDGKLDAIVQMRSNDVVFGYRNDFAWQQYMLERVAGEVGEVAGTITWQVGSLHVYERHFNLLEELTS